MAVEPLVSFLNVTLLHELLVSIFSCLLLSVGYTLELGPSVELL